eukprot:Em0506g3a
MQEKGGLQQEMLEESKEREALMAVQLRREVQRRLFRTPTSPLTQPHPPQPVPQPSPLLGMVEIEDPILQEVEPEVDEVAQVEERATWQSMRKKIRQHLTNTRKDGCIKISCCIFKVELMQKQKLTPRHKYEKWDEVARHLSSHLMCNHKAVTTEPEIL